MYRSKVCGRSCTCWSESLCICPHEDGILLVSRSTSIKTDPILVCSKKINYNKILLRELSITTMNYNINFQHYGVILIKSSIEERYMQ